jgi:hypothetical protein
MGDDMSWITNFIKHSQVVKDDGFSWIVRYSLACIVLIVAFIGIFRHVLGLDVINYGSQIGVAALFGIVGVIGLSVALMAATFYSSRSGVDDAVQDVHDIGTRSPRDGHDGGGPDDASSSQ